MIRNSRLRGGALALAATAALVVAGRGGDGGSPEEAVSDLYSAAADGDYARVCDLLSVGAARATIDEESAGSCEEAAESSLGGATATADLNQIEVGEATVDGDTGTVEVTLAGQSGQVNVVQEDGEWKLDDDH